MPLVCLALLESLAVRAQSVPESDMKAAFIYNFMVFTEWPPAGLEPGTINVCVNGASPVRPALQALGDKSVKGRRVVVSQFELLDLSSRNCGVLFIDRLDRHQWQLVKRSLTGWPVLTITDEFEPAHGERAMVTFSQRDHKLVFDIDMSAVRQAGLSMSSKLLRLARSVQ